MTETTPTKALPRLRQASDARSGGSSTATMPTELGPHKGPAPAVTAADAPGSVRPADVEPWSLEDSQSDSDDSTGEPRHQDWEQLEPRTFYARYGKRAFNLALLCVVSPFALALSLPIALVNWIQFGHLRQVLYCQPRVGRRGRTFSIFKFRTMREASEDDFDSWSQGQDRLRVTRFGRLLRNTHLDELPQLLNILRGEMDFIGPRPEMVEIDRWACAHVKGFRKRNALVPGITGYAQITQGYAGKDDAAYAKKLAGDELYRRRLSFFLDLVILMRTGAWMIRGRGWRFSPQKSARCGAGKRGADNRGTGKRGAAKRSRKSASGVSRRDAEQSEGLSETSAA